MQPAGDVLAEHPADRELEVALDAPPRRRQQHPVEAGHAERVAGDRGRSEDGTGVGAHDVPAVRGAGHGVVEGGHLGQGVGILARLLRDRGVLAVEAARRVEEGPGAHGDHSAEVERLRRVEHVLGAADVDRLEVGHVLAGATEERGTVDGGIAPRGRPQHGLGVGHVAR